MERYLFSPMHRLRQLELSWFRSGQTTSLLASVREKDEVNVERGGILATPYGTGKVVGGSGIAASGSIGCGDSSLRREEASAYDEDNDGSMVRSRNGALQSIASCD
jgi:hypothetical protein